MISRDQNRANVIIWSIANETPHSAERDTFLSRLAKKARQLDDSRLISPASRTTTTAKASSATRVRRRKPSTC